MKVYRIPEANRTSAGRSTANVLQLKPDEKIASVIAIQQFVENAHLVMATRQGLVKKTELMEYSRPRQGGIIGINLEEGDALIDVALTHPGDEIVLSTREGMAIRFNEANVRSMGRGATGVWGIKLDKKKSDIIVGMVVADPDGHLLTLCENGYGKRTPFGPNNAIEADEADEADTAEGNDTATPEVVDATPADAEVDGEEADAPVRGSQKRYPCQKRGGKGKKDVKVTKKNGPVVGIASVRDGDEIMVITTLGMVVRTKVDDIRIVARNTQGVKVMTPSEGDKIRTLAKLARTPDEIVPPTDVEAPTE